MPASSNAIKKVKIPNSGGVSTEYEVIPEKLQNSGYTATPPTLTKDSTLVTSDQLNPLTITNEGTTLVIEPDTTSADHEWVPSGKYTQVILRQW